MDESDEELLDEVDEFQRLIDVLVLLRFERQAGGSEDEVRALMDQLVTTMVAAEARVRGAPTFYAELAKRILAAEELA